MGETEAVRGYPSHWEADVVLRDGATAHLRPISPEDAAELQRMHAGQSENSIYLRYFTYKSELSAKDLDRFTHVDHRDRVAFVITRGGRLLGVGRYDRYGDSDAAEVAFNISDAAQGRGLGSILMEHLAVAARENGIRRFTAEVLPENRKMLSVFQESGFEVTRRFEDGVVAVEFPIDPTARWRAVVESREHRAEARSVAELVAPESVAVVGASRDPQAVGSMVLRHILEGGFAGPVHAVNRAAGEVQGLTAHASLAEIGEEVELVVVAVPVDQVEALVPEAAAAGAAGLLVLELSPHGLVLEAANDDLPGRFALWLPLAGNLRLPIRGERIRRIAPRQAAYRLQLQHDDHVERLRQFIFEQYRQRHPELRIGGWPLS